MTICFTLTSIANHLPATFFLWDPKRLTSLGLILTPEIVTVYSPMAGSLCTILPRVLILQPGLKESRYHFCLSRCLNKIPWIKATLIMINCPYLRISKRFLKWLNNFLVNCWNMNWKYSVLYTAEHLICIWWWVIGTHVFRDRITSIFKTFGIGRKLVWICIWTWYLLPEVLNF